jgi:hypothetical protein
MGKVLQLLSNRFSLAVAMTYAQASWIASGVDGNLGMACLEILVDAYQHLAIAALASNFVNVLL